MNRIKNWSLGIKDGMPICFGYFAVSFAFGIQAKNIGMTIFQAVLMSVVNLTSAGQLASLGIIAAGASYLEMAATQLVINIRYSLMSCILSQKLEEGAGFGHRLGIAFGVTDEIFGVSVCRKDDLNPFYSYGLMTAAIPGWALGTLCGVISGSFLPAFIISALGIAIYGMFIAIIIPVAKKNKTVMGVVILSMGAGALFKYAPMIRNISPGFQIIIITVVISAAAAVLFPLKEEKADA